MLVLFPGLILAGRRHRQRTMWITLAIGASLSVAPLGIVQALPKTCAGDDLAIPNTDEFGDNYDCYHY